MINSEREFLATRIWLEVLKSEIQDRYFDPQGLYIINNAEIERMEVNMRAIEASLQEYRPYLPE